MEYIYNLPENFDPAKDDAGSIHLWLQEQGCNVEGVSILTEENKVVVDCDHDPKEHLDAFPVTITEQEQLAEALDQIDIENASEDELRTAVTLLKELLIRKA